MYNNVLKSLIIFILFKIVENNNIYINDLQNNVLHKTNENVQYIKNKLFSSLGLISIYQNSEHTQNTLKMFYKLKNIFDINLQIYEMITDICDEMKSKLKNSDLKLTEIINNIIHVGDNLLLSVTSLENVNTVVDDILKSTLAEVKNITQHTKFEQKFDFDKTSIENNETVEIKNPNNYSDSTEFLVFLNEFLQNINNLTPNDFVDQISNLSHNKQNFGN